VAHFNPDLILFYGFDTAAQLYPINQSIPTAFHVQELPEESWKLSFVLDTHPSALYIAISEYIADRLRALGVSRRQIEVVHNGIDVEALEENGDVDHAGPKQGAEDEANFHVGIVGQVGDWKGHEDLVEALALLRRQAPTLDVTLHIAGTGEEGFVQELKEKADRLGVAEQMWWHGFVDDIGDVYALLDVVVVPSRHEEPFGLVAAEAGLWQRPVVATRRGGLPEVVADGETGVLVDSRSPDQIAARLRQLADDPELRDRMGKKGERRVKAKFSVQDMVEGVHDAIIRYFQE
jgi:glycosyltransferase involved in cell wall biosynthesis